MFFLGIYTIDTTFNGVKRIRGRPIYQYQKFRIYINANYDELRCVYLNKRYDIYFDYESLMVVYPMGKSLMFESREIVAAVSEMVNGISLEVNFSMRTKSDYIRETVELLKLMV